MSRRRPAGPGLCRPILSRPRASCRRALGAAPVLLAALAALACAAPPAHADSGAFHADPMPAVHVSSNGTSYVGLVPYAHPPYGAWVNLQADAGLVGVISNYSLSLSLGGVVLWQGLEGALGAPDEIDLDIAVAPDLTLLGSAALAACSANANALRDGGSPDAAIFGQAHTLALTAVYDVSVGQDIYVHSQSAPIEVVCDAHVPPVDYSGLYAAAGQLTSAAVYIAPAYAGHTASCPLQVPATVVFAGTGPLEVAYRLVNANGHASPQATATLAPQGAGYQVSIDVPIPVPTPWIPVASGGGGVAPGGSALGTTPGAGDPVGATGAAGHASGIGGVSGAAAGVHQQSWRVEVLSPVAMISQPAGYHVTCTPGPVALDIGGATGQLATLQPPPQAAAAGPSGLAPRGSAAGARRPGGPSGPGRDGGIAAGSVDIVAGSRGFMVARPIAWGQSGTVAGSGVSFKAGVGRRGDHCLFRRAAFSLRNLGTAGTGPFTARVFVGREKVHEQVVSLAAGADSGWLHLPLELPAGRSRLRVEADALGQVAETDEHNSFTVDVDVQLDCAGRGSARGLAPAPGSGASAATVRAGVRRALAQARGGFETALKRSGGRVEMRGRPVALAQARGAGVQVCTADGNCTVPQSQAPHCDDTHCNCAWLDCNDFAQHCTGYGYTAVTCETQLSKGGYPVGYGCECSGPAR